MTLVLLLAACGNDGLGADAAGDGNDRDTSDFEDADEIPPQITFTPLDSNQQSGEDVVMEASIADDGSGVFTATLYFRNETDGSKDWKSIGFVPLGSDLWKATIGADEQHSGGMWYYIRAVDYAQNESFFPEDGDVEPLHFGFTD